MTFKYPKQSWRATLIFYIVLLLVVIILDWQNHILLLAHLGTQIGLITLGIIALALIGHKFPDLTAPRGVLLAFGIGVLTIIPGVLLALNPPGDFWSQYFTIGFSMAAGSFLGFLFIKLTRNLG